MTPEGSPLVVARGIARSFTMLGEVLEVLEDVDLTVGRGEIIAILGASGVGKSTLLHILGALDRPSRGSVSLSGQDVFGRSDGDLAEFRNRHVGFVFQFHHLLPEFTALENVMMPGLIGGESGRKARERARILLENVGLSDRERHKPHELSGGEQQRVAVARALFREPELVIADEPSGNLDPLTAERLHELVYTLARDRGQSWVIATHNESLARIADNRNRLIQGRLVPELPDTLTSHHHPIGGVQAP
jgi:lipoprotein-releasing system ATP-binding protein